MSSYRNPAGSILVLALVVFVLSCDSGDDEDAPQLASPVLGALVISASDASSITLQQPTLSVSGTPAPEVYAWIGPYLGRDGAITVTGGAVDGALQGPIDVSHAGHIFAGLDAATAYKIVVFASNTQGYSAARVVRGTDGLSMQSATVSIDASTVVRMLPSDLYGTQTSFIENGSGALDPSTLELRPGLADKCAELGVATIRFPGGSLSRDYQWWYGIGPKGARPEGTNIFTGGAASNNYGTDEHHDFCEQIGAVPVMIANVETGTPVEAANWVEYCNGDIPASGTSGWTTSDFAGNEAAPPGYFAWLRGQYGRPDPFDIKHWEVANEVYDVFTQTTTATEYAVLFIEYANAMRAIDPSLRIAAIGYEEANDIWNESGRDTIPWNQAVARTAGAHMDAISIHQYAPVSTDGRTCFYWGPGELLTNVSVPAPGDYEMQLTARGMNNSNPASYPFGAGNFANLSVKVDGVSQATVPIETGYPRVYQEVITFAAAGSHTLGLEHLNFSVDRQVMLLGEVRLVSVADKQELMVDYTDQTPIFRSIMAAPLQFRENIEEIDQILVTETSRSDIEIWITEFNTFYSVLGLRMNRQYEFMSAVSLADMAIQQAVSGADIIQVHSMLDDFYFGMIHDATTLGEPSMFHTYSLLIEGLKPELLSSTVSAPTFDLAADVGWVHARSNVSYVDVMPMRNGDELSVIIVNKHPTDMMEVAVDVGGFTNSGVATLKTVHADDIGAMDHNRSDDEYDYAPGKVGSAINLSASSLVIFDTYNKVIPLEGTVEFWLKPDWHGNDGIHHPFMSIGIAFLMGKFDNDHIYVVLYDDEFVTSKMIFADVSSVSAEDWVHVALTWDVDADSWAIYVNGAQASSDTFTFKTYVEHHQPMILGTRTDTRDVGMDGMIDEFRVMNVARSASEIAADYAAGTAGTPLSADAHTTMLLHFDETLEDSVVDQRTYVTTQTIDYQTSGGNVLLPPCSVNLLETSR